MALVANVVIVGVSSSRIIPPHGSANRIVHSCKVKGKSMRICSVQLGNQALFMETGGFRSQQQWGEWRLALVLRCWFLLPYAFPRLGIVIQFHFTKGKRIANFCFSDHTPTNMGVAQGHSGSLEDKTLTHNLITWVTLKYERQAEHTSGLWIHLPYSNQLKYKGRPHERNDPKILTTCFGYKVSQIGSWNWIFFFLSRAFCRRLLAQCQNSWTSNKMNTNICEVHCLPLGSRSELAPREHVLCRHVASLTCMVQWANGDCHSGKIHKV
jgi:hypothetical protein